MGSSIDVTNQNFATEVVEKSYEKPVLIDFFATWCGPCQMLKPILDKLLTEYDFALAKVDIDRSPDLASAYQVEGVPDVRIVRQGKVEPGFVGVLAEPQLRQLLGRLGLKSGLDAGLEALQAAMATEDQPRAQALLTDLRTQYPENPQLFITEVFFLFDLNQLDQAETLLNQRPPIQDRDVQRKLDALQTLIQFKRDAHNPEITSPLDEQYFQAIRCAVAEDYEEAFQGLLAIVERDRQYRKDGARKAMVTLFDFLGDDDPLTQDYRRQLTRVLY